MTLPRAQDAIISETKLVEYLLDPSHPENGGKAAFFFSLGFNRRDWETLARHYGFTEEKLGFTMNYDLKYSMGRHTG